MNMHMPKSEPIWSGANIELLKRRWSEGRSATEVALEIGHGATRSAVIGKVHRLKLVQGEKAGRITKPRQPRTKSEPGGRIARADIAKNKRVAFVPNALVPLKREPFRPGKVVETIVDDVAGVALVDLTAHTCRWPLWGFETLPADKRFCGAEPVEDSPYCAKHKARGLNHA